MTLVIPHIFADYSLPVKNTLTCYRALSDARYELTKLDERIQKERFILSSWKVSWIGICAVLRTSFEVIGKIDARSCIDACLRDELRKAWAELSKNKDEYPLFWKFLKKERDGVLHQYEWKAYGVWLNSESGQLRAQSGLLDVRKETERTVLLLRTGPYAGENSMEILNQCADFAERIIFDAIVAAGYAPEEEVFLKDFAKVVENPDRRRRQRHNQAAVYRTKLKQQKQTEIETKEK